MKNFKCLLLLLSFFLYACSSYQNTSHPVAFTPNPVVVKEHTVQLTPNEETVINFADNNTVYFDFDVFTPKKDDLGKIENQIKWLQSHNFNQILIEGYTDIYGTREYNLALGERRADSIRNIFIENNIDPRKIKIISYGKERLADNNIQYKNRRTVTRVLY